MSLKPSHITKAFLAIAIALFMSSCLMDHEIHEPERTEDADKVLVPLFADPADYGDPATRAGQANENGVGGAPWVFVYKGTDGNATIAEITQAYVEGGKSYVKLCKQTGNCLLFILANPPAAVTYGEGYSWLPELTQGHLNERYGPSSSNKTLSAMLTYLRTPPLGGNNTATNALDTSQVPYTPDQMMPMTCLYPVNGIDTNTKIGTDSANKLELERLVAKIIVQNKETSFEMKGATILNTPNRAYMYRLAGKTYQNVETTNYIGTPDPVENIAKASTGSGDIRQTTAANPIYVYDIPAASNNMAVIIKGVYDSKEYYYRLSLTAANGAKLDIRRNYIYTFNITQVLRGGFETFEDAKAANWFSNEDIIYSLGITDQDAYDNMDNGKFFLGVSNSIFHVYSNRALTNVVATKLYTDAAAMAAVTKYVTVEGTGLTLRTPAPVGGRGAITASETSIAVDMASTFTSGKIIIKIGDLKKEITVERKNIIVWTGSVIKFPAAGDSHKYVSAHSDKPDWLVFSYDGVDNGELHPSIFNADYTSAGGFHLHVRRNTAGAIRNGLVFVSRLDNSEGRIRLYIEQGQTVGS